MRSFTVPFADDRVEVDTVRQVVLLYRNAWNRGSSGIPDETYPFDVLRADRELRRSLTAMLAASDAAELERLIDCPSP